jgi:hypothetical protein
VVFEPDFIFYLGVGDDYVLARYFWRDASCAIGLAALKRDTQIQPEVPRRTFCGRQSQLRVSVFVEEYTLKMSPQKR